jgi:NADH dehydrogenase (ubiquinone) Fe-S protein 1
MNSKITGVEECDLLLFVGCNPRLENPVLNARVRKMQSNYGLKVGLVGSVDYITYEYDHLGTSTNTLEDILSGNHYFSKDLDNAKLPMIIVGSHALQREDGEGILKLLLDICDKYKVINPESNWNGFNVLNKNVGSIGALELGISSKYDAKAKPKLVFLLGSDNFRPEEIPEDAFVVYLGTHGDEGAARADLILPGAAYTEKSATYVNIDGRVLSGRVVVSPPGQARVDWEVIRALSEVLSVPLPYDNLQEIRFRIAELAPHLIKYDWIEPYSFNIVRETLKDKVNHSVLSDYIDVRFI